MPCLFLGYNKTRYMILLLGIDGTIRLADVTSLTISFIKAHGCSACSSLSWKVAQEYLP